MTFLPIVGRELRAAARRPATYLMRMLALGVSLVVLVCFFPLTVGGQVELTSWGRFAFIMLTHMVYVLTLFSGIWATADCLSVEQREDTLGLLFLTNLNGQDVVLGKMAAHSLTILGMVLAVLPAMALPLLAGGVSASEYGRAALAILTTLFFSLSAGLFVSSRSRHQLQAMAATLGVILLFACGLPLVGVYCFSLFSQFITPTAGSSWLIPFFLPSPGFALAIGLHWRGNAGAGGYEFINWFLMFTDGGSYISTPLVQSLFFESVLVLQGISWCFIYLAGKRTERYRQGNAIQGQQQRLIHRLGQWLRGNGAARRKTRRLRLASNPYYWVLDRDLSKQRVVWCCFGFVGLSGPWVWWIYGREFPIVALMGLVQFVHPALKIWLAAEVCQTMAEDRRSGAFELILTTPLEVRWILRGQVMALSKRFLLPMLAMIMVEFFLYRTVLQEVGPGQNDALCQGVLVAGLFLLPDALTIVWLSMWRGLASGKAGRSFFAVISLVMLLPSLVYLMALIIPHYMMPWPYPSFGFGHGGFYVLSGFVLVYDLVLLAWARRRIIGQFLKFAAQH